MALASALMAALCASTSARPALMGEAGPASSPSLCSPPACPLARSPAGAAVPASDLRFLAGCCTATQVAAGPSAAAPPLPDLRPARWEDRGTLMGQPAHVQQAQGVASRHPSPTAAVLLRSLLLLPRRLPATATHG